MSTQKLRVWHIPQVPGKPFHVEVPDLQTAKIVIDALANYDLFQLENKIKPDYANSSGLEVYDEQAGGWTEWQDAETGMWFDEYSEEILSDPNHVECDFKNSCQLMGGCRGNAKPMVIINQLDESHKGHGCETAIDMLAKINSKVSPIQIITTKPND